WNFCQTRQITPFDPEVNQVLEFLSRELQYTNLYSSFITTRSAISLISNKAIGNHPLIKRFGKGVSIIKPEKPRYDFIWDPAPVVEKLAHIFPYESLSLDIISRKLILLLALGSGRRAQYSTRHASTSLAVRKGISLELVKRAAGWSGKSRVFANFYNRPIVNPESFCNSVLLP
ncbi:hypothetical protein ALC57_10915, partial [Trachymyrmex cornetzi]